MNALNSLVLLITGFMTGYIAAFLFAKWGTLAPPPVERVILKPMEAKYMPIGVCCLYCKKYVRHKDRVFLPGYGFKKIGHFAHAQCVEDQKMLKEIAKLGAP